MEEYSLEDYIKIWKEQYGPVYLTTIKDIEFYFRLLPYAEYQTLGNLAENNEQLEEFIAQTCVLEPRVEDWHDSIFAGFVTTLARTIREESFIDEKPDKSNNIKDVITANVNDIDSKLIRQIPLTICQAFPAYKPSDIKEMALTEQIELYSEAIWVLSTIQGLDISFDNDDNQ